MCSGHTFARNVWRRQVLDMFLDTQFFRMPSRVAIADWLTIVDNMVANDKVRPSCSVSLALMHRCADYIQGGAQSFSHLANANAESTLIARRRV